MPNRFETAKTPGTTVAVANNTSTPVAVANRHRAEIIVTNNSAATVYLRLAATGASSAAVCGVRLNANGGSWTSNVYRGAVSAWQNSGGAVNVLVVDV